MQYRPYDPIGRYMSPLLGPLMAGVALGGAALSAAGCQMLREIDEESR